MLIQALLAAVEARFGGDLVIRAAEHRIDGAQVVGSDDEAARLRDAFDAVRRTRRQRHRHGPHERARKALRLLRVLTEELVEPQLGEQGAVLSRSRGP